MGNEKIFFCLKLSQEKWIKQLRNGTACFTPVHYYIEKAEKEGNDEQGDKNEGVFARLLNGDHRIELYYKQFGTDLEIIPDGKHVLLRRKSTTNIPVFCIYGIYRDDLELEEPIFNMNGSLHMQAHIDISKKMYQGFLQKDDVWGFYASAGHFFTAIESSLKEKDITFRKVKINYTKFAQEEFCIEPTDAREELNYKFPKYAYQNEARVVLTGLQQDERYLLQYPPLNTRSAGIAQNELRIEAMVQVIQMPS